MVAIQTFWTPIIWNSDVKSGSKCCAFYTIAISSILMTFVIYMMCGGDSTQLYLPLFETDVRASMQMWGAIYIIYFITFIISSVCVFFGLHYLLRGLLIPWLAHMFLAIVFQLHFGLWLLYGYYIYLAVVVPALLNWLWMGYNIYCFLCVYSQYQVIYELQTPNIELLYP